MIYLKATFVGLVAALVGAVLTVLVPLSVQLIRMRLQARGEPAGAGAVAFVLNVGFGSALFLVVAMCFVGGFWWTFSRN